METYLVKSEQFSKEIVIGQEGLAPKAAAIMAFQLLLPDNLQASVQVFNCFCWNKQHKRGQSYFYEFSAGPKDDYFIEVKVLSSSFHAADAKIHGKVYGMPLTTIVAKVDTVGVGLKILPNRLAAQIFKAASHYNAIILEGREILATKPSKKSPNYPAWAKTYHEFYQRKAPIAAAYDATYKKAAVWLALNNEIELD